MVGEGRDRRKEEKEEVKLENRREMGGETGAGGTCIPAHPWSCDQLLQ